MITKLLLEVEMGFSSHFLTFPAGVVGWVLKMKLMLSQLSTKLELKLKLKLSLAIMLNSAQLSLSWSLG